MSGLWHFLTFLSASRVEKEWLGQKQPHSCTIFKFSLYLKIFLTASFLLLARLHLFQQDHPTLRKQYNRNLAQISEGAACHFLTCTQQTRQLEFQWRKWTSGNWLRWMQATFTQVYPHSATHDIWNLDSCIVFGDQHKCKLCRMIMARGQVIFSQWNTSVLNADVSWKEQKKKKRQTLNPTTGLLIAWITRSEVN